TGLPATRLTFSGGLAGSCPKLLASKSVTRRHRPSPVSASQASLRRRSDPFRASVEAGAQPSPSGCSPPTPPCAQSPGWPLSASGIGSSGSPRGPGDLAPVSSYKLRRTRDRRTAQPDDRHDGSESTIGDARLLHRGAPDAAGLTAGKM